MDVSFYCLSTIVAATRTLDWPYWSWLVAYREEDNQ